MYYKQVISLVLLIVGSMAASSFTDLPSEIREGIYGHLFDDFVPRLSAVQSHFPNLSAVQKAIKGYRASLSSAQMINKFSNFQVCRMFERMVVPYLVTEVQKKMKLKSASLDIMGPLMAQLKLEYGVDTANIPLFYPSPLLVAALLGSGPFTTFNAQYLKKNPEHIQVRSLLVYLCYLLHGLGFNKEVEINFDNSFSVVVTRTQLHEAIERLLQAGVDPNFGYPRTNPLIWYAFEFNDFALIDLLARYGVCPLVYRTTAGITQSLLEFIYFKKIILTAQLAQLATLQKNAPVVDMQEALQRYINAVSSIVWHYQCLAQLIDNTCTDITSDQRTFLQNIISDNFIGLEQLTEES
ncbi:hypothetical protein KG892_03175 [Vermiphilus pyriformis]|nr:MAG: hypothetical protein KG892_03175 [Vermiphilus pyriformis]